MIISDDQIPHYRRTSSVTLPVIQDCRAIPSLLFRNLNILLGGGRCLICLTFYCYRTSCICQGRNYEAAIVTKDPHVDYRMETLPSL